MARITPPPPPKLFRSSHKTALAGGLVIVGGTLMILTIPKLLLAPYLQGEFTTAGTTAPVSTTTPVAFPIGVNPKTKTVSENPLITHYIGTIVASNHTSPSLAQNWFTKLAAKFAENEWFQNLASPISRLLVIQSGERQEEITTHFARILGWTETEKETFRARLAAEVPELADGKLYPGNYVVEKGADPDTVATAVADKFDSEVRTHYTDDIESVVPM